MITVDVAFSIRLRDQLIPRLKKMISDEIGHRKWLVAKCAPESFISESTGRIRGLENALEEYMNYLKPKYDNDKLDNNGVE